MTRKRVIELSHVLARSEGNRKLEFNRIGAEEVATQAVRLEGQWYIMHEVSLVSHIGTHIEAPYHLFPDGADLAEIPIDRLVGRGICLQFKNYPPHHLLTLAEVQAEAGDVEPGDLVFCNYGFSQYYGTDKYQEAPRFEPEALRWLADRGIALLAVEAGGVELIKDPNHTNHVTLLEKGIPLVENVANLDQLTQRRFDAFVTPVRIKGLESFPVAIVAVETVRE